MYAVLGDDGKHGSSFGGWNSRQSIGVSQQGNGCYKGILVYSLLQFLLFIAHTYVSNTEALLFLLVNWVWFAFAVLYNAVCGMCRVSRQVTETMRSYAITNEQMSVKAEMIEDSLIDAVWWGMMKYHYLYAALSLHIYGSKSALLRLQFDEDDMEEEVDAVTSQVLAEIGVDLGAMVSCCCCGHFGTRSTIAKCGHVSFYIYVNYPDHRFLPL